MNPIPVITGYELRTLPASDIYDLSSELIVCQASDRLPIVRLVKSRYVLDYLNGAGYLGRNKSVQGPSLTEDQTAALRLFIDEIIVSGNTLQLDAVTTEAAETYNADLSYSCDAKAELVVDSSCMDAGENTPGMDIPTTYCPVVTRRFSSLFGLFVYECFDMLQTSQPVRKCACCGNYFTDWQRSTRKYCSEACKKNAAIPTDDIGKKYRTACNTKNRQVLRLKGKSSQTDYYAFATAFCSWQDAAKDAREKITHGLISMAEYDAILKLPLTHYTDRKKAKEES